MLDEIDRKAKKRNELFIKGVANSLREKDARKHNPRKFILFYERKVNHFLIVNKIKPKAQNRYELVATLFYGIGLESDFCCNSILSKYLGQPFTAQALPPLFQFQSLRKS